MSRILRWKRVVTSLLEFLYWLAQDPVTTTVLVRQEAVLAHLLASMFTPDQLYFFLKHQAGSSLVQDLPPHESTPRATYAAYAAEKLIERRLLTRKLLRAWVAQFPGRASELYQLCPSRDAETHHCESSPVAAPTGSSKPSAPRSGTFGMR